MNGMSNLRKANDHDERDEQLEEGRESQALLRFGQRFGGKRPLDDVLVEAPVVEVGHPQSADEHRNARQIMVFGVVFRQNQMHTVTRHVGEMLDALHYGAVRTDDLQRHHGGDKAAQHEQNDLQDIRPSHRRETTGDGIERGNHPQPNDGGHDERTVTCADDGVNRLGAEEEHGGEVHEDEQTKPKHRENGFEIPGVTLLYELRDGVNSLFHKHRHEKLGHDDEGERGHELVGSHCKATREARPRHPDELLRRDVRGYQRRAYRPPRQRLARKKVVLGGLILVLLPMGNPDA